MSRNGSATKKKPKSRSDEPSPEARRVAAAVLEVLAGMRTPTEAAQAISVSLPRYYLLERRALDGLVAGCEPRKRGYRKGPQQRIAELEKEVERLKRECDRHQALARASQRSVGLTLPAPSKKKSKKGTEPKRRRKRRPTVRALKAAKTLKAESSDQEEKTSPETRR